jgi:D-arabinose 1-dehydrogenase-like Zn-dependent alcohol dehydrogenase
MRSYDVTRFGAPLELIERPTPVPQGSEVLLRVLAAGICHSDLHIWEGAYDMGGGRRLQLAERGITPPITMGHEIVGEVAALGPAAEGVRVGDRRVVYPWIGCGNCAVCRRGDENYCMSPRFLGVFRPGGYSDHVLVPHGRYLVDLHGLDPAVAAPYACSGLTTYSALKKLGPALQQGPVVVIGAGGLGLMLLTLLKAMGGKGAVVVDIDGAKRQAALKAGALAAIDGAAPDAAKQVAAAVGAPIEGVIDLVGASATARLGTDLVTKGGKYIICGLFGGDLTLSLPMIPLRALTVQGSYVGNLAELHALLELVQRTGASPIPITRRPLDEADVALHDLHDGKQIGRAVLTA